MWQEILKNSTAFWIGLGFIAVAIPFEFFRPALRRKKWSSIFANIGASAFLFIMGPIAYYWTVTKMSGSCPRASVLRNPFLYSVAFLFLQDAFFYMYHRLQHAVPFLWEMHKFHHTDRNVDSTTSRRTHFLEFPIQALLVTLPTVWLLGRNTSASLYILLAWSFMLFSSHMNVRLSLGFLTPFIVGPQYHRIHHGRGVGQMFHNYSQVFPVLDILFGTYLPPKKGEFVETGVPKTKARNERWKPMVWPLFWRPKIHWPQIRPLSTAKA